MSTSYVTLLERAAQLRAHLERERLHGGRNAMRMLRLRRLVLVVEQRMKKALAAQPLLGASATVRARVIDIRSRSLARAGA